MVQVVQHKETRQFLGVAGGWTAGVEDAAEFDSVRAATSHCLEQSIRHSVQVVLLSANTVVRLDVFPSDD